MNINTASYNNYSQGMGYALGNSTGISLNPYVNVENKSPQDSELSKSIPNQSSRSDSDSSTNTDSRTDSSTDSNTDVSKQEAQQPINPEGQLTRAELQLVTELKQVDSEVRRHEMAHVAAGGGLITSGANFTYKRGPDGQNYAVAGEVGINTSAIPGDPQATVQKMQQVKTAALAPANPSAQDLKVASQATAMASKALSKLMVLRAEELSATRETQAFGNLKQASDSYVKVNNLPEEDTSTFKLAV